ncbi:FMN-dependent dehydrogenase, partial [Aureobasidium melanogenum]
LPVELIEYVSGRLESSIFANRQGECLLTAKPQMGNLPAKQKSAPNAIALNTSVPRRIPPSTAIGIRPLAAGAQIRSASSVAGTLWGDCNVSERSLTLPPNQNCQSGTCPDSPDEGSAAPLEDRTCYGTRYNGGQGMEHPLSEGWPWLLHLIQTVRYLNQSNGFMTIIFTCGPFDAYGFPRPCERTSSIEVVAHDESPMAIPYLAAALEVATSPSGCARQCMAAGAKPNGIDTFVPQIVVLGSTVETSRRTRGRILYLL